MNISFYIYSRSIGSWVWNKPFPYPSQPVGPDLFHSVFFLAVGFSHLPVHSSHHNTSCPHPRSSDPYSRRRSYGDTPGAALSRAFLRRPPPCLPALPPIVPPLQHPALPDPAPPAAIGGLPVGDQVRTLHRTGFLTTGAAHSFLRCGGAEGSFGELARHPRRQVISPNLGAPRSPNPGASLPRRSTQSRGRTSTLPTPLSSRRCTLIPMDFFTTQASSPCFLRFGVAKVRRARAASVAASGKLLERRPLRLFRALGTS